MEYLKTAMETLVFNILISCKWFGTNPQTNIVSEIEYKQ